MTASSLIVWGAVWYLLVVCTITATATAAPFDTIETVPSRLGPAGATGVTVVSGHWVLDNSKSKHPIASYYKWWKNALSINANLVFYTDNQEVSDMILNIRQNKPTVIIYRNISSMSARFSDFKDKWLHRRDVPSKEIGVIWLDKIFMIQDAMHRNPYQSNWFCWHDAGNAYYRDMPIRASLWPSRSGLQTLPTNKFIYTSSWYPLTDHSVAGTSFMFHKNIMNQLIEYFWAVYKSCDDDKCGSDQILFSRMKDIHPDFFYQIGYGYGILVEKMFLKNPVETHVHNRTDVCDKNNGIMADLFQIMKNTEKKDPQRGFKGLCKPLWKTEYPEWQEDYAQFLREKERVKTAKIERKRAHHRLKLTGQAMSNRQGGSRGPQ